MNWPNTEAVIFDFDGVLVESTDVKTHAFGALYRVYGEAIAARAIAYHLDHAGISRYIKFRHLHRALLGVDLTEEELMRLGERFSRLVVEEVVSAPWVAGSREFVESHYRELPLFVASGTPEEELRSIVARRGMAPFFKETHGAPATKDDIALAIIAHHGFTPRRVLIVGDAKADLEGAREAGARFLGRVHGEENPFPPDIKVVPDLTGLVQFL